MSPESDEILYVYKENHIVRRGILLYYDPLLCSDLYEQSLSFLNTFDNTLPLVDPSV
jgi:hypothetical protein